MVKEYNFKSKAETLKFLSGKLKTASVLPLMVVDSDEFYNGRDETLDRVRSYFDESKLIIRSSSKNEDTIFSSNAGKYESVLNVDKNNRDLLEKSIEEVFRSYEKIEGEEVLIQPMMQDISKSGVVFTCDLETYSPYYIVNYHEGEDTTSVTGGFSDNLKTYISFKENPYQPKEKFLRNLLSSCKEIENIFSNTALDIEFGVDKNDKIYIFQTRPIVIDDDRDVYDLDLGIPLRKIYKKVKKLSRPHPNLLGKKAVFGVMPDWNPAEIIGLRPKKLAISLYKELIMNSTWAYQRDNYGYRNLRSHPLMVSFLGIPFIDVRVSFNSFIPKKLNDDIAEKLLNHYLDKLTAQPQYHDKVEFEIVHSCYHLNLPNDLKQLKNNGFNDNKIKRIEYSLLELTNDIIKPKNELYKMDLKKAKILEKRYDDIINSELSIVDKIYWLTEDCKRYGTLPFAGVARSAFIGIQFLRSFVDQGIMNREEYDSFLNAINTVNKQMNNDLNNVLKGKLKKSDFLSKYGHIRPGTYDILSKRYDENFEQYFSGKKITTNDETTFEFSDEQIRKIQHALVENGIEIDAHGLVDFIRKSIEGREYLKFVFTKSLSKQLMLIEEFGERCGVSREELAHLDIKRVLELYSTIDHRDVRDIFMTDIEKNKIFYKYEKAVRFPSIITKPENVYGFHLLDAEPNFITLKNIISQVVREKDIYEKDLEGKIVMIKSADPGYDFLFSKDIGGLITQFGGANSHMAIRCAELCIPAVIGAGEYNFNRWCNMQTIEINCLNKLVRCIK